MRSLSLGLCACLAACTTTSAPPPPPSVVVEASNDQAQPSEPDAEPQAARTKPKVPYWAAAPTHHEEEAKAGRATRADKDAAVKAYREARKLFDSGDHAGALAYFIEAHGHVPGAAPMIKIAECLDALGRTADAIDAYAWFIGSKPSEKFADRVKVAEERLAVLGVAPAEPTAADLERARATFQHALEAFEQGDFATACPGFELAYDLSRSVNALLNVAVCRDKLGERARACTAYARYLKEKGTGGHRDAALDTCPGVPPP